MGARITVVGAGVIGLTSAVRLAEAGHQVDVLARELPLETTSATAGGLWLPFLAEPVRAVARWSRLTLEALLELAADPSGTGPITGVAVREGYLLGARPGHARPGPTTESPQSHGGPPAQTRPDWAEGLDSRLELAPIANPTPAHSGGWHLRVPLVDMRLYLPYLVGRLQAADGTLTRLPLTALPSKGVVVNATGLAARALAADPSVHPVRGQVVWLTNPGLTTWWSDTSHPTSLTYVIPHAQHVVVGGTSEDGDFSTTPDEQTANRILARARELVPALRTASVLQHRVGLRPARPTVRLETVRGREGTVVHCYGHGGSGVTLSWGCADDVLAAVNELT
jgi:D-amino-acid oxidase